MTAPKDPCQHYSDGTPIFPARHEKECHAPKESTPTPLSRAQKRLEYWQQLLTNRKKPCNSMMVGSIGVSIEEDRKLDQELIAKAEAAVKDWREIVRAVNSHDALLEVAKRLLKVADTWQERYSDGLTGLIETANKAIADAEKPL